MQSRDMTNVVVGQEISEARLLWNGDDSGNVPFVTKIKEAAEPFHCFFNI